MTITDETTGIQPAPLSGVPAARGARLSTVFLCVFAIGGFAIGMRPLHDNSFMWHVRTGRLILDSGIPRHDPYSFSAPGVKWVAQSWLAELVYGIINGSSAGAFGLRLFGGVVGLLIGLLLFCVAYRSANDRVRGAALALLAMACLLNVWSARPLMLGILAMLVLVVIVELPDTWIARRPMISLPVLVWLWANVHGTFVLGFGYLALHLLGRVLEGHAPNREREWDLLRGTLIAGVAILANPYFIDLVLFPLRLMGRGEVLRDVSEWQSPDFREAGGVLFGVFLVTTLVVFARKRPGVRDLLITVVFLVLGLWAVRNVGLAVVAILPILARLVRNEAPRQDERRPIHTMMVGLAALTLLLVVVHAAGEPDWKLKAYPVDAFKAVQAQELEGRHLFTTDAWGGYLIASAWPQQKVFFDDRYDTYPIAVNDDYTTISHVEPAWLTTLDKYQIDVVMWPRESPLVQALAERDDWVKVYDDKLAVVFAREKAAG